MFERSGIADRFERPLSVEQASAWKPAAAAYRYALAACEVQPEQAMLVAAHPWDIHGARHAGLATAFVNRTGATYPEFFERPDLEVAALTDLTGILAG